MLGLDISPLGKERIFVDPKAYADLEGWHQRAAELRRDDPFPLVTVEGLQPFRVVTRHGDVLAMERDHQVFHNTETAVLRPLAEYERNIAAGMYIKSLVQMDGDEHRGLRGITNDWFKPANLRRNIEGQLPALARKYVDLMLEREGGCDFARDIALFYPLQVILGILGIPPEDESVILNLTQNMFGSEDPELSGVPADEGTLSTAILDVFQYFQKVTADRRENPTSDVATAVANATLQGEPLGEIETMGYYAIIATAGHDTTSSSLSGGLEALIRHPEQLAALQADPSLIPNAVDEIIRWVTPVRHFMRQAQTDTEIAGRKVAKGEWFLLSYLSANRDESLFADPMKFDIYRENASEHIAFGTGVHFCLGAHLAKMELRIFLEELLPRIEAIELVGDPAYMETTFVGGPKRMPIRYKLKAAA